MARTLLVIGDRLDAMEQQAVRPRRDHEALAAHLGADVLDASVLERPRGRMFDGAAIARVAARRAMDYDNVFCDSEHIAIPLSWLLRSNKERPRLTFIAHYLTPMKKRVLVRLLRTPKHTDSVIVHSATQEARALALGFGRAQVERIPYQVDAAFFSPQGAAADDYIASAGQEFRDYATLLAAVDDLPVRVDIAAGSHWSRRKKDFGRAALRDVRVERRGYRELRAMYDGALFAVVPLHDVDFQAGIITILEAMAMGKAVVVSRTRGQSGTISGSLMEAGALRDIGEQTSPEATGIYVPPADAASLRDAISYLLERPDVARRMGEAGREHVLSSFTLEHFVDRVGAVIAPETAARMAHA
ncbi:MAG TPA: glycosyltransferase family 4 protein [Dehalococcoidia bacterium]|nr:glycosyltransferase family 4 protein [Dehalococcoidia bacterium]